MKKAEFFARQIAGSIAKRKLKPGDMLPREKDMLAELGVGRGTLREALRYLEILGIVVIRPGLGGGPAVAAPDRTFLAHPLSMMLQAARTPFQAILECRSAIEPVVTGLSALNASDEELQAIRESVERMRGSLGGAAEGFLMENFEFHSAIAWSSGNPLFGYLFSSLHWIIDGHSLGVDYPAWSQKVVLKAHERICKALEERDADRARAEMTRHNELTQRYMNEYYPALLDKPVRWD
jgi:DNA-binding FadR family transcriptional regulator